MSESSFASLNPALLARKGGAKPAMRPQHGLVPSAAVAAEHLEDLGWNDMGTHDEVEEALPQAGIAASDSNVVQLPAQDNEVHRQQQDLASKVLSEKPAAAKRAAPANSRRSALARGKRAAFTLRLDAERHLKLRLASTVKNRSAQQIVTDALDAWLDDMPDIETLASQVSKN